MLYQAMIQFKLPWMLLLMLLIPLNSCDNTKSQSSESRNSAIAQTEGNQLAKIKQRGKLICGINKQLPGFSYQEPDGSYSGISVDLCRAIAVALFNDPKQVEFRHLDAQERFAAVASGKVDLLSRNTTWTMTRDTTGGLDFPPTNFYDGQGLLVANNNEIETIEDLNGKSICVAAKTTSEANLESQMRKYNLSYNSVTFEDLDQMYQAYESGQCDAATSDRSELVVRRSGMSNSQAHKIIDEVLSKEPLGPVIANNQPEWFDVVEWVSYALIKAEEMSITSQNVDRLSQSKNPTIRRFLGQEEDIGKNLGLNPDFARNIIKQVGNYGEIYDRNIGKPFNLERGANALVKDGGLLHAPPFR